MDRCVTGYAPHPGERLTPRRIMPTTTAQMAPPVKAGEPLSPGTDREQDEEDDPRTHGGLHNVERRDFQGPEVESIPERLEEKANEPERIAHIPRQQWPEATTRPLCHVVTPDCEEREADVPAECRAKGRDEGHQSVQSCAHLNQHPTPPRRHPLAQSWTG